MLIPLLLACRGEDAEGPGPRSVDQACADDAGAMARIDCHREVAGVTAARRDDAVGRAAGATVDYVVANPDVHNLYGKLGPRQWLTQQFDEPAFTGSNAYERLTDEDHGAGYVFTDLASTGIWEYVTVVYGDEQPEGAALVDLLMADPTFRQLALQPSWIDGGFAEGEVDASWFEAGGWTDSFWDEPVPTTGRVVSALSLYRAPALEHAGTPLFYPADRQRDVPLASLDGLLSYPITVTAGARSASNYDAIDQNQYDAHLLSASIVGPDGPLEVAIVHPGDEEDDDRGIPAGHFLRTTIAIYALEPFAPSTTYEVEVVYSSPEVVGPARWSFETAPR